MTDIIPYFVGLISFLFAIGFYLAIKEQDKSK